MTTPAEEFRERTTALVKELHDFFDEKGAPVLSQLAAMQVLAHLIKDENKHMSFVIDYQERLIAMQMEKFDEFKRSKEN